MGSIPIASSFRSAVDTRAGDRLEEGVAGR
jgi:hypothetical protein